MEQKSEGARLFLSYEIGRGAFLLESERKWKWSHGWLFATPWTAAYQAPLSMGFSRQKSWSGLPFPSPGTLPDPGIESRSPALQAGALTSEPPEKPYLSLLLKCLSHLSHTAAAQLLKVLSDVPRGSRARPLSSLPLPLPSELWSWLVPMTRFTTWTTLGSQDNTQ